MNVVLSPVFCLRGLLNGEMTVVWMFVACPEVVASKGVRTAHTD